MLRNLIYYIQTANIGGVIAVVITSAVLLLLCMPVHEFAHAFAAHKLGDDTAKYQGRMTVNPARHFDLLGAAMILLVGVGYAKPVPVNMMNFRNRKRDMALTAAAGPISNLLMGIFFTFIYVALSKFVTVNNNITFTIMQIVMFTLSTAASINISLAVFNLIPIPPFDGSRILGYFLPDSIYYKIMQYERIIFIIVLVLLVGGFMSGPLSTFIGWIEYGIQWLVSLPFGGM